VPSRTPEGEFTLENIAELFIAKSILDAYWISRSRSALAASHRRRPDRLRPRHGIAIVLGGLPAWVRSSTDDLFRRRLQFRRRAAGLRLSRHARPLGLVTVLLRTLGINLYATGFNLSELRSG
jgi:putative spermidine/putrescine transport system permease protein